MQHVPLPISIHAPREGSDRCGRTGRPDRPISIHAPREGSDARHLDDRQGRKMISIHAPREGSDGSRSGVGMVPLSDFYPRSPRGERHRFHCASSGSVVISIHAPREGSDVPVEPCVHGSFGISIHAPREGSDVAPDAPGFCRWHHFYPRSPRGERPDLVGHGVQSGQFLSTLPARGATRVGGFLSWFIRFLSTLPARGATPAQSLCGLAARISIHAPREGSDVPGDVS